jgi:hypothetical protein
MDREKDKILEVFKQGYKEFRIGDIVKYEFYSHFSRKQESKIAIILRITRELSYIFSDSKAKEFIFAYIKWILPPRTKSIGTMLNKWIYLEQKKININLITKVNVKSDEDV